MRYLKVDVKELHSPRLARLASELNISAAEALGILMRFWAVTRTHHFETATDEQMRGCLEVTGQQANAVLKALGSAGYVDGETITDNAGINTLTAKRSHAGKLGAAARLKTVSKPKKKTKADIEQKEMTLNGIVWRCYADAYMERWGTTPVRNQKANALIMQLVKRLGGVAGEVARFYVAHNDGFYLQKTHDLQFLVRDCETLHTQMQRGHHITRDDVRQAERENHHLGQLHRVASGQL